MRNPVSSWRSPAWFFGCLGALTLLLAGCQTSRPDTNNAEGEPDVAGMGDSEVLRAGDLLKITFRGPAAVQIPDHQERIPESGQITLQYIGKVDAVGRTRVQLQDEIRSKYVPDVFRELSVTIAPAERFFYVSGEVRKPDRHPYLGEITLREAIAAAGDFTDFADKRRIQVTRTSGRVLRGDYIRALEDPITYDLKIFPGDKIVVKRRVW